MQNTLYYISQKSTFLIKKNMKKLLTSLLLLSSLAGISGTAAVASESRANPPIATDRLHNGILIEHFIKGTGKAPFARDKVTVHYMGRLSTGEIFDSSYERREPSSFYLTDVISCWSLGMQKIREGGYARIGCPSHTAYGKQGVPGAIPPDSILFFDVELLSVN